MVAHACNWNLEAEGGRLGVQGQFQLWIKLQASLGLIQFCFKNNKNTDLKKVWWPVVIENNMLLWSSVLNHLNTILDAGWEMK